MKSFKLVIFCIVFLVGKSAFAQEEFRPDPNRHDHVVADSLTREQYSRAVKLSSYLMAPCCYSKTTAEDQSGAAHAVKDNIKLGIMQGFSDDAILSGFAEVYGERILARPTSGGFNILVWILPGIALLIGGAIATHFLGKQTREAAAASEEDGKSTKTAPQDAAYLERVDKELNAMDE